MRHPDIPRVLRGTYAGLAHPAMVEYLVDLGINAIELMPIHQFVQDGFLQAQGKRNYWGYNTIGFFAPHNEYAVDRHPGRAGQRVQGDGQAAAHGRHRGDPRRGLQPHRRGQPPRPDAVVPRASTTPATTGCVPDDPRHYFDTTGTGNSMNVRNPHSLQMIMDSLRYWVTEMHVDGFRFDLASSLAREFHEVDKLSTFFDLVQQDPVVSQAKLIAEPWDLGEGGYQVGNFPSLWTEWNGKYRDTTRDYWRGEHADPAGVRLPVHRVLGPVPEQRPQPARLDQLRDRPRRLHAGRPGVLQRQAQRRQRRGRPRRGVAQPVVELRRGGPHARPVHPGPASAAAAQHHGDPAAEPGGPDDRPWRRDRAHPEGQQQHLLPGQRAVLDGLGRTSTRTCWPSPGS